MQRKAFPRKNWLKDFRSSTNPKYIGSIPLEDLSPCNNNAKTNEKEGHLQFFIVIYCTFIFSCPRILAFGGCAYGQKLVLHVFHSDGLFWAKVLFPKCGILEILIFMFWKFGAYDLICQRILHQRGFPLTKNDISWFFSHILLHKVVITTSFI